MSDMLEAALYYEACGLSVIPWAPVTRANGKADKLPTIPWKVGVVPRLTEAAIRLHWATNPKHNVGIITGWPSGVIVLDADTPEAAARVRSELPATPWLAASGRGGGAGHFGMRYPNLPDGTLIKSSAHLGCKLPNWPTEWQASDHAGCMHGGDWCHLDIRADKGFIAMAPSIHPSGRPYTWESPLEDLSQIIAEMPLFDLSWFPKTSRQTRVATGVKLAGLDWDTVDTGGNVQAARAWMNLQPPAIDGQNGRNQTFKVAAGLCRDFGLTLSQSWDMLQTYNQRCCPPWDEDPLRGKLEDAWQKGSHQVNSWKANNGVSVSETMAGLVQPQVRATITQPLTATSTPATMQPASVQLSEPAAALATGSDEAFAIWLPAEAARRCGVPFMPEHIATAARISRDSPHIFQELSQVIRDLKVLDHVEWKKLVRAALKKTEPHRTLTSKEGRKEIVVNTDPKDSRDALIEILKTCPGVFTTAGKLSYVGDGTKMVELAGGALRNFIVDAAAIVTVNADGEHKGSSVPSDVMAMLEDMLPDMLRQFRNVVQVTKTPFFTPSGNLVSSPGYDAETSTVLVEAPSGIDPSQFATAQDAINYIWGFFSEFEFQSMAEFANYLGAMLTPMLRPSYRGATPWLMIEANMMKSGKTLLADCLQIIYGCTVVGKQLPFKEEEIIKDMLTVLMEMMPVVVFDNVRHCIDSPCLEGIATAEDMFQARVLGKSESRTCPVRQLFVLTINNATTSADFSRRLLRVRLKQMASVSTSATLRHRYQIGNLRAAVAEHRPTILSALIKLVQDWIAAGKPVADTVPIIPSFEAFSETVGAVLHHAGRTDWGANWEEAKRSFSVNDDWKPFFAVWWDAHRDRPQYDSNIMALATQHGLLGGITAKAQDHGAKLAAFRNRLNGMRDYVDNEYRVCATQEEHAKVRYWLEKVT